eukprot:GHVU01090009.1.p1 GENE.GHVU01090009.1~~GHVU01090009.1.p1  ORF type:complete len:318 (-),score=69.58 GHVU01090009.1:84-1037(-)
MDALMRCQVFKAFGDIVNIDMPKEGARSKGFCFVEYSSPQSAEMSLSMMQGFQRKGRGIKVGRPTALGQSVAQPPQHKPTMMASPGMGGGMGGMGGLMGTGIDATQAGVAAAASLLAGNSEPSAVASPGMMSNAMMTSMPVMNSQGGMNRIYIGSVPYGFTPDDIKSIFQAFGPILNCQLIPSNERPGTHRGYGFIEFATSDQAKLAIETMNGFEVSGKQLKVNYATALRNSSMSGGTPEFATGANASMLGLNSPNAGFGGGGGGGGGTAANPALLAAAAGSPTFSLSAMGLAAPPAPPGVPFPPTMGAYVSTYVST